MLFSDSLALRALYALRDEPSSAIFTGRFLSSDFMLSISSSRVTFLLSYMYSLPDTVTLIYSSSSTTDTAFELSAMPEPSPSPFPPPKPKPLNANTATTARAATTNNIISPTGTAPLLFIFSFKLLRISPQKPKHRFPSRIDAYIRFSSCLLFSWCQDMPR